MAHGARKWANVGADEVVHSLADMAELAARLKSPDAFNREGNVIWMDDFSGGRSLWDTSLYGAGAEVEWSAKRAMSPPYSLKLVTGQDGGQGAKTTYQVAYHVLGRYGFEYAFAHDNGLLYHFFQVIHYDGDHQDEYMICYDVQNRYLMIREPGPVWTLVGDTIDLRTDGWLFHVHKMVIDVSNLAYVRLILDNEEYDLSAYEPYRRNLSGVPYLELSIQMGGDVGANREIFIDNVIITQNEPS